MGSSSHVPKISAIAASDTGIRQMLAPKKNVDSSNRTSSGSQLATIDPGSFDPSLISKSNSPLTRIWFTTNSTLTPLIRPAKTDQALHRQLCETRANPPQSIPEILTRTQPLAPHQWELEFQRQIPNWPDCKCQWPDNQEDQALIACTGLVPISGQSIFSASSCRRIQLPDHHSEDPTQHSPQPRTQNESSTKGSCDHANGPAGYG